MSERPFDPGLQPERTSLAWQRTALSIAIGSLVYARVEAHALGSWAWGLAVGGVAIAALVGMRARSRYRYAHRSLTSGTVRLADGLLPACLAVAVAAAGVLAIVVALLT